MPVWEEKVILYPHLISCVKTNPDELNSLIFRKNNIWKYLSDLHMGFFVSRKTIKIDRHLLNIMLQNKINQLERTFSKLEQ